MNRPPATDRPAPLTGNGSRADSAAHPAVHHLDAPMLFELMVAAQLTVPASAGLLYWPGDVCAMTEAVLRLPTTLSLRSQMPSRTE
jgi:hypothetical protein